MAACLPPSRQTKQSDNLALPFPTLGGQSLNLILESAIYCVTPRP